MRILVIGLSRDLPLGPADAMELADHLVKRAAGVQSDGSTLFLTFIYFILRDLKLFSELNENKLSTFKKKFFYIDLAVLQVERIQLIDAVLNLCTYHHPENIQLPAG